MRFDELVRRRQRAGECMTYVMHRHGCSAWCRPPLHAGLTFSRRPDDIADQIRTDYEGLGYGVLHVSRAFEVPLDDPRLIIRPHPWLVLFVAKDLGLPNRARRPAGPREIRPHITPLGSFKVPRL